MSMFHELMMKKKGIPSRYQEVEYIESTGTQWIDTGIVRYIDHTYRYVGEVSFSDITNRQVMGVQGNAYFGVINGKYQIGNPGTDTVGINAVLNTFVPFDVTYDIPNQKIYYSIAEYLNLSRSQSMLNTPPLAHFHLFSLNDGVLPCSWKLKPIQIYDNGTLVRNYIPVYDTETQKYGMWESVQGKFCGNAGTGDFKGSIVGYTVVGNPTIVDGVVSGFSGSNYLTIQQYLPDNFEMFITFTTPNSWTNEYEDVFNYRQLFNIEKYSTNISTYNWTNNSYKYIVPNVKTNTKYSVKIIKEGTSISFWYKEENNDFVLSGSLTTTKTAAGYSCFGINQATSGRFFTGFINLNETYIKSNNKLWFNGQQA